MLELFRNATGYVMWPVFTEQNCLSFHLYNRKSILVFTLAEWYIEVIVMVPEKSGMVGNRISRTLQENHPYVICEKRRFKSYCASIRSEHGVISFSIFSGVSIDSVSGQRRPRSDCANAQSDLSLRYPHKEWNKSHYLAFRNMCHNVWKSTLSQMWMM